MYNPNFLGTAKLLQLTEGMEEDKKKALLTYIAALERREKNYIESIQNLIGDTELPLDTLMKVTP